MHYFQWDPKKATLNEQKHRVSFAEGATVFFDESIMMTPDPRHSEKERRFIVLGKSDMLQLLFVSFTFRRSIRYEKEIYRIISVRVANKKEKQIYLA
jgi:uncharacterized DUF497 family protein